MKDKVEKNLPESGTKRKSYRKCKERVGNFETQVRERENQENGWEEIMKESRLGLNGRRVMHSTANKNRHNQGASF